jgi:hypothetical protein
MNDVDILAEIRAWRDEFARVHDYDLGKMRAALHKLDLGPNAVMVRGTPRPPAQPFVEVSPLSPTAHLQPEVETRLV